MPKLLDGFFYFNGNDGGGDVNRVMAGAITAKLGVFKKRDDIFVLSTLYN